MKFDFASTAIEQLLCTIHVDPYPDDLRKIGLEFEERFRQIKPTRVIILPTDKTVENVPSFVAISDRYLCEFYTDQIRNRYVPPKDKVAMDVAFSDFQDLTSKTFAIFGELAKASIQKAGIVAELIVPANEPGKAVDFIFNRFFKLNIPRPYSIDFHYALKQSDKYNINVNIKPVGKKESPEFEGIGIRIDINNYDEIKSEPNKRFDIDVIGLIGREIKEYYQKTLVPLLMEQ
jgi:hypothetical protein